MMDDIFGMIILAALVTLSAFGSVYLAMDFRHFSEVERQCKEQGYIQNQTTRILCSIEAKP
jgi:hypothetical protein